MSLSPNIAFAIQQICLYMHDPREPHLHALKQILRYVRGTLDYGLQLYISTTSSLVAYSDADWGDALQPDAPLQDTVYFLETTSFLGPPKDKAPFPDLALAEAEYRGVANTIVEIS